MRPKTLFDLDHERTRTREQEQLFSLFLALDNSMNEIVKQHASFKFYGYKSLEDKINVLSILIKTIKEDV